MNTYFRTSIFSQSIVAVAVAFTPALGGALFMQTGQAIASTESVMDRWQAETTAALNRALTEASAARLMAPNSAIVRVVFSIGPDGRAGEIKLLEGEGNWSARRAALHAIRQLDTLQQVPIANPHAVRFIANLVFYRSLEARDRLLAELREWERVRAASNEAGQFYLAIGNH